MGLYLDAFVGELMNKIKRVAGCVSPPAPTTPREPREPRELWKRIMGQTTIKTRKQV